MPGSGCIQGGRWQGMGAHKDNSRNGIWEPEIGPSEWPLLSTLEARWPHSTVYLRTGGANDQWQEPGKQEVGLTGEDTPQSHGTPHEEHSNVTICPGQLPYQARVLYMGCKNWSCGGRGTWPQDPVGDLCDAAMGSGLDLGRRITGTEDQDLALHLLRGTYSEARSWRSLIGFWRKPKWVNAMDTTQSSAKTDPETLQMPPKNPGLGPALAGLGKAVATPTQQAGPNRPASR